MNLTKSPVVSGLFILVMLLTGCPSTFQRLSKKPVEKVNDHVLTVKEFSNQLARKLRNFDALAAKDPNNLQRIKEEILQNFLITSLTLDWAKTNEIVISENDLDKEVNKLRMNYPDDLSFRRSLAKENLSFADWREDLRNVLIQREVFRKLNEKIKAPTEEEIRRYYEAEKEHYKRKERIYIQQIVVDNEAKADAIMVDLKTKDFAETAKKYSITPEAKNGGNVGWIEKGTVDYFDPLFSNSSGIKTIKSPFGIHLVRIQKKAPASTADLPEVRQQIIYALRAQREQAEYIAWLDAQIRSSRVLRDYELMNTISVDTRGLND